MNRRERIIQSHRTQVTDCMNGRTLTLKYRVYLCTGMYYLRKRKRESERVRSAHSASSSREGWYPGRTNGMMRMCGTRWTSHELAGRHSRDQCLCTYTRANCSGTSIVKPDLSPTAPRMPPSEGICGGWSLPLLTTDNDNEQWVSASIK